MIWSMMSLLGGLMAWFGICWIRWHIHELMAYYSIFMIYWHISMMMFSRREKYMFILFFWESIHVLRRGVIKIVLK